MTVDWNCEKSLDAYLYRSTNIWLNPNFTPNIKRIIKAGIKYENDPRDKIKQKLKMCIMCNRAVSGTSTSCCKWCINPNNKNKGHGESCKNICVFCTFGRGNPKCMICKAL